MCTLQAARPAACSLHARLIAHAMQPQPRPRKRAKELQRGHIFAPTSLRRGECLVLRCPAGHAARCLDDSRCPAPRPGKSTPALGNSTAGMAPAARNARMPLAAQGGPCCSAGARTPAKPSPAYARAVAKRSGAWPFRAVRGAPLGSSRPPADTPAAPSPRARRVTQLPPPLSQTFCVAVALTIRGRSPRTRTVKRRIFIERACRRRRLLGARAPSAVCACLGSSPSRRHRRSSGRRMRQTTSRPGARRCPGQPSHASPVRPSGTPSSSRPSSHPGGSATRCRAGRPSAPPPLSRGSRSAAAGQGSGSSL